MIEEFPINFPKPNKGLQAKTEENIIENNFGDGYSQRVAIGINYQKKILTLTWTTLTSDIFMAMEKWLRERKNLKSFYYQHYDDDKKRQYVCTEMTPTNNAPAPSTITATFKETFEIGV